MCITGHIQGAAYQQAVEYLRPGGSLLVVGLPGKATIDAPIFWTVVKGISILGSYVGCAPSRFSLRQHELTIIAMSQEPTRRARSTRNRRFGQDQVPPRDQAVGGIVRVRFVFRPRELAGR